MAHVKGKCGEFLDAANYTLPKIVTVEDVENRGKCALVVRLHTKLCGGRMDETTIEAPPPDAKQPVSHPKILGYQVTKVEFLCCPDRDHKGEQDCEFTYRLSAH